MNKFREKFIKINYDLTNSSRKDKLEHAIELWCYYANIPQEIKAKIDDTKNILSITFKAQNITTTTSYSNKGLVAKFLIPKIKNMDIITYAIIALLAIGIAYVIYQLNQPEDNADFSEWSEDRVFQKQQQNQKYCLILAIDPSKSGFLQNIKESDNFIRNESICENLFLATNYLWIGKESEDISLQKIDQYYKVKDENKKNFDVYIVEIILDEYISGFEKDVKKTKRLEAFEKLINHKITMSERLSFEACSDLYSI
ncbi:hypothetical protein [Synechocystis sp. CACIAM 05]|uniref:hypothetical protein n=1 Tax=Synechocystis sp. CACIAM 05 TaxID=1933929 RepID=UPI00138E8AEA|nr:hypothetical protein [Synechocystis sp. CACIAM 05]QHV00539.1 hypothetical protein BWK47_10655 [Synechocystis sp. CACIAM 05]